ncbi:MAG: pentapeptide repeat-containing protein [Cyanosarcina radialis HA8281-LM2]|jgi:uncharacterized protein YjbI with pentapeptide repeats|nr:pentapeptide repeat-containing protein [Cyanosarcina radialis HA8281-LM2]
MKNLWSKLLELKEAIYSPNKELGKDRTILLDSAEAAENMAFMLGGRWDNCNGVVLSTVDEIAIEASANLVGARWFYQGKSCALLPRLSVEVFQQRLAAGEKYFINANLMGADLSNLNLSQVNLSWAKLRGANLSGANLRGADLTQADLSDANLSETDLTGANLTHTILNHSERSSSRM